MWLVGASQSCCRSKRVRATFDTGMIQLDLLSDLLIHYIGRAWVGRGGFNHVYNRTAALRTATPSLRCRVG